MIRLEMERFNSATIFLPDVKMQETNEPITDATVTVTFQTPDGTPVADYTNLPMYPIVDKPGWYSAPIDDTFDLPVGRYYLLFVGIKGEDGFEQKQEVEVKDKKR